MSLLSYLIIGSAVGLVFLLWVVVGVRHLIGLRRVARDDWEALDGLLRKRHDLIPLLVETVRGFDKSRTDLEARAILNREKASREYGVSGPKMEYENDMSHDIIEFLKLDEVVEGLKQNLVFMEVKTDFKKSGERIRDAIDSYNKNVRKHNHGRRNFLLAPLAFVGRFKRENIFELE